MFVMIYMFPLSSIQNKLIINTANMNIHEFRYLRLAEVETGEVIWELNCLYFVCRILPLCRYLQLIFIICKIIRIIGWWIHSI